MDISKHEHFARLHQTTEVVWPAIEALVESYLSANEITAVKTHLEVFLKTRRGKPLLRPYLARIAYESAGGTAWKEMGSLLAATELLNISTYQSNMCFDDKHDGWGETTANNQFISSMLTFSLALRAVNSQPGISEASRLAAMSLLSEANSQVYLGQFMDLNTLSLKNMSRYTSAHESVFMDDYLKRCRLIGSSMFRIACIGAFAATPHPVHIPPLSRYFELLGLAGQMLNDLADYMPDANRPYANQYGDLRLGRLTFPTYCLARANHPVINQTWSRNPEFRTQLESATSHLFSIGIESKCRDLLNSHCWIPMKVAMKELSTIVPEPLLRPFTFARHYIFESRMLRYFEPSNDVAHSIEGSI